MCSGVKCLMLRPDAAGCCISCCTTQVCQKLKCCRDAPWCFRDRPAVAQQLCVQNSARTPFAHLCQLCECCMGRGFRRGLVLQHGLSRGVPCPNLRARPWQNVFYVSCAPHLSVPAFACVQAAWQILVCRPMHWWESYVSTSAGPAAGHLIFCPCVQAGSEGITNSIEVHSISATVQEGCMKQALEVRRLRQACHVHSCNNRMPRCSANVKSEFV